MNNKKISMNKSTLHLNELFVIIAQKTASEKFQQEITEEADYMAMGPSEQLSVDMDGGNLPLITKTNPKWEKEYKQIMKILKTAYIIWQNNQAYHKLIEKYSSK